MIKKLVITIAVLFLAIGAFLPHAVNALATPADYNIGKAPADLDIFGVRTKEDNTVLHNCPYSSSGGFVNSFTDVFGAFSFSTVSFQDRILYGLCPAGYASDGELRPEEITAYFNTTGRNFDGIAGLVTNLTAGVLTQRTASGVDYIADKVYAISNYGKVNAATSPEPNTYYPGPGSELLRPIQGFWGWSVNLVFGFLILLIIVIALAIMFRQRLGGAAEVTLQNAIPSIALAMILIPLSYAISGLFIDAITLGTNAVHGFLLGPQSPGSVVYQNRPNKNEPNCDLTNTNVKCDGGLYANDPLIDVWRARDRIDISGSSSQIAEGVASALNVQVIFSLVANLLRIISGNGALSDYTWFGNLINAIIGVLTIWISLKIFKRLINKYLTLLLFPAFSPFVFATAALPGNGTKSIVGYLKSMGAAALFYIVTYAMFLLTLIFTNNDFQNTLPDFRTSGYIPPLLGLQSILRSINNSANSLPLTQLTMTLVGLGVYFSIPSVLDGIDKTLGTDFMMPQFIKTPFQAMGESFKVTRGFVTRTVPGAVGRTGAFVRNTTSAVNPVNAWNRFRDSREAKAGFTQNTPASRKYGVKKELDEQWAKTNRLYQQAVADGNTGAATQYKSQLDTLDKKASSQGVTLSHSDKPEDQLKLLVTFKADYGGSENAVSFTPDNFPDLEEVFSPGFTPTVLRQKEKRLGKFVFTIQGTGYSFTAGSSIEFSVGKKKAGGYADEKDFNEAETPPRKGTIAPGVSIFKDGRIPAMSMYFKDNPDVAKNGKVMEVPVYFTIDDNRVIARGGVASIATVFGEEKLIAGGNITYTGGQLTKDGSNKMGATDDWVFKVVGESIKSDAYKLLLGVKTA